MFIALHTTYADVTLLQKAFGMGMGTQEIMVLMVAVLLIFGPRKIPEVANFIGKTMRQFRKASMEIQDAINQEVLRQEREEQLKKAREAAATAREKEGEPATEYQDPYTYDAAPPDKSPDEIPELEHSPGTVARGEDTDDTATADENDEPETPPDSPEEAQTPATGEESPAERKDSSA